MAELFTAPTPSPVASFSLTEDASLVGKADRLGLLADVCFSLASVSEAEEELSEIRGGSLTIQVNATIFLVMSSSPSGTPDLQR